MSDGDERLWITRRLVDRVVLGGRLKRFVPRTPLVFSQPPGHALVRVKRFLLRSALVRRVNEARRGRGD